MLSDLTTRRDGLWPYRFTTKWDDALQGLTPYPRGLVQRFMRPGVDGPAAICQALGLPAQPQGEEAEDPQFLAVGCVLVHAALDLLTELLSEPESQAGRAYELYFREDYPLGGYDTPATLVEAIAQASGQGEQALVALVAREASSRLGLPQPSPSLTEQAARHIESFKLLGHESRRIML